MSILPGVYGPHATTGTASSRVDAALSTRVPFQWKPNANKLASLIGSAPRTIVEPAAAPVTLSGDPYPTLTDDWYNRVHVVPQALNLGVIAYDQTQTIELWNAWFTSLSFTGITGTGQGITMEAQNAPPLTMPGLSDWLFKVDISTQGPSTIASTVHWQFTGKSDATLQLSGTRLVPWMISPQWSDSLVETYEWKTDVMLMKSGVEQRRVLRINPRRTWEFSFICQQDNRRMAEAMLFAWGLNTWLLPVWTDSQYIQQPLSIGATFILCNTADLDFEAGGLAILTSSPLVYEVLPVQSVLADRVVFGQGCTMNWGNGTRLIPVRKVLLENNNDMTIDRITTDAIDGRIKFLSVDDDSFTATVASSLPQYRTYPVIEDKPEYTNKPKIGFQRNFQKLDYDVGTIANYDISNIAFQTLTFDWLSGKKSERTRLKELFYMLRGQDGTVWIPSMADDLVLLQSIANVDTTIAVSNVGYTNFLFGKIGRQDIRMELYNGTVFYRRIIGSTIASPTQENLQMDSSLGQVVNPSDVKQISFMTLSRLNGDMVEIDYETDSVFRITATFRGVGDVV